MNYIIVRAAHRIFIKIFDKFELQGILHVRDLVIKF